MDKSILFTLYNRLKKLNKAEPKAVMRLNKALGICQRGLNRYLIEHDHTVYFDHETHSMVCTCEDFKFRNSTKRAYQGPCKHLIASKMAMHILITEAGGKFMGIRSNGRAVIHWHQSGFDRECSLFVELLLKMDASTLRAYMNRSQ